MDDAKRNASAFRNGLEFRRKLWFWLIVTAMAGAIWFGLNPGERAFNDHFGVVDKDLIHAAGPPLAVGTMSLVAALIALVNVFRKKPIRFDVPTSLGPWLPAVTAIAGGILIGTTIFR